MGTTAPPLHAAVPNTLFCLWLWDSCQLPFITLMCKVYFVLSCYLLGPGGKGRSAFELATPYLNTWEKNKSQLHDCSMCFKCLWQEVRASCSNVSGLCHYLMTMVMMMKWFLILMTTVMMMMMKSFLGNGEQLLLHICLFNSTGAFFFFHEIINAEGFRSDEE